ncbi:MAG: tRNA (guanosine(37)-N1)-methyltransferase TrmD [Clostridiales bacterium]|nr:MAG: tRNA (guanosine(37)-N1)-methyltransferase TrmD [Clostridiales bacterium]
MKINILTLFPDMVRGGLSESIIKRAIDEGRLKLNIYNIRDFTVNKRRDVDDAPYGGGAGLIMQVEPIKNSLLSIDPTHQSHIIYVTPKGKQLTQERVKALSESEHLTILCGHYEGFDQRIIDTYVDEEISIGDYILTGGELAAMVIVDAVVRLKPGVLNRDESHEIESFEDDLLEYPQYTRPECYCGLKVPEILLSGNHQKIEEWRYAKQLEMTYQRRPDLFRRHIAKCEERADKKSAKRLIRCLTLVDLQHLVPQRLVALSGLNRRNDRR